MPLVLPVIELLCTAMVIVPVPPAATWMPSLPGWRMTLLVIVAPPLLKMGGIDPVWLGVVLAVNLQTSYMHPPLGPTVFYLRSVAPPGLTTQHIYVGVIPFVLIQLVALVALWFVPGLATALPHGLYGG